MFITTPFVPISSYSTPFELKHALTLSKPTRLFIDAKFLKNVLPVAKEIGMDVNKIHLIKGEAQGRRSIPSIIRDVRNKQIPPVEIRPAARDTLAYLIFSSGTSGLPKGNLLFLPLSLTMLK
jgi:acyl-CoA synthetase (AMP-forming)/AMP-acid ligase II